MTKEDLRIVFMGTPEFAVPTLKAIIDGGYNVVAVVTQPDRPVGRHGSVLQPSQVKQFSLEHGLPVLQPEKMKDPEFVETLRSYNANLQVVVAFRMLPEVVWAMPKYGTFNVHAALLPQYRGAAPINWAIINGEKQTGVTTFFLDHDIDTGRIILQKKFDIPSDADVEYVYDGLMRLGADICLDTLDAIVAADGHPDTVAQSAKLNAQSSMLNAQCSKLKAELKTAPKLFKENCRIDWSRPAEDIRNFIRGLSPIPEAWSMKVAHDGKETMLKIYKAHVTPPSTLHHPFGSAALHSKEPSTLTFPAGEGTELTIDELQLAGKKRMPANDFLNGMKNIEKYSVR